MVDTMNAMILIYITCHDSDEAVKIGTYLLRKRLIACYNIIDNMTSGYWWPPGAGQIETAHETILIVKTLQRKFDLIERSVERIHSSDTPCLIAIPAVRVAKKYLAWIEGEVK